MCYLVRTSLFVHFDCNLHIQLINILYHTSICKINCYQKKEKMEPHDMKINAYKFKYALCTNNNRAVIEEALSSRKVWAQIPWEKMRNANLIWRSLNFSSGLYSDIDERLRGDKSDHVMLNHFQHNLCISVKSRLVQSLKSYYSHECCGQNYHVFETIPTTFVVNPNKQSTEFKDFLERFAELQQKNFSKEKMPQKHCENNIWYIKPEAANQGRGITLTNNLKEIQSILHSKSINTSFVIQKSIEKPLLYKRRKFDVRVWALVTSNFDIYYYKIPYIRTSSFIYDEKQLRQEIHLTNNFQQKKHSDYSKHEKGNTIPFCKLREELIEQGRENADELMDKIYGRMKNLIQDCFMSVKRFFLRQVNKKKEFQLFGFDFLIDEDLRTWLLEVNDNPHLGTPNEFIKDLMPKMINQMFEIVLDPLFEPVGYKPVEVKNFELLHKEVHSYRISSIRSGSTDNKRKNYYPLIENPYQAKFNTSTKNRRNSEALSGFNSFSSTQKQIRPRYTTPVENIRYHLQNYCFNDLQPFSSPVWMVLTSTKLQEEESLQVNLKNLKLITETRVCSLLLEPKFILHVKRMLESFSFHREIKACLLNGYDHAIRTHKNRLEVREFILATFPKLFSSQKHESDIEADPLLEAQIKLLIKMGGKVDRSVFIPGETKEKQNSREYFINSRGMEMLMYLKEAYPNLCKKEIKDFLDNLNKKDWQLYESVKKTESKEFMSQSTSQIQKVTHTEESSIGQHSIINLCAAFNEDKKRKSSYSERFEFSRNQTSILPKIKK